MSKTKGFGFILSLLLLVSYCGNPVDDGDYRFPAPVYPRPYSAPSWSADGKTIVFCRIKITSIDGFGGYWYDPDSTGIWAIDADGSNMRLLIRGRGDSPELSPDGEWLVYEEGGRIYKARYIDGLVDTSEIIQLTTAGRNFYPAWSPDGKWIAYDSNVDNPGGGYSIWIMDSDGNNKRMSAPGRMADWSPDGKYLIFIGFHCEIYRVSVEDTSEVERLTFLNQGDIYAAENKLPVYSSDGKKIAFESNCQIWVMNSDGTDPRQITTEGSSLHPSWSPDGRIVYVHDVSYKRDVNNGTLWVMNADGTNQHQLTFNYGLKVVGQTEEDYSVTNLSEDNMVYSALFRMTNRKYMFDSGTWCTLWGNILQ